MPHARKSPDAKAAPPPRCAFTIAEFAEAHRISQAMYFKLRKQGKGPREKRAGNHVIITVESAADWRAEREAEATTAANTVA